MKVDSTTLAVELISAYVSHNKVSVPEFLGLIIPTIDALDGFVHSSNPQMHSHQPPLYNGKGLVPAVPISKSVTSDYIICLEDGLKFKTLKLHLIKLGMTPEQYKEKWGLPDSYPLISANYLKLRRELTTKDWANGAHDSQTSGAGKRLPPSPPPTPKIDPASAPQPEIQPRKAAPPPSPPSPPAPTALADALKTAAAANPVAAKAIPLEQSRPKRMRHDKRAPVKVQVKKRRHVAQPVTGRAGLASHMNGEVKF